MYVCLWSDNVVLNYTCTDAHLQMLDSFVRDLYVPFMYPGCDGFRMAIRRLIVFILLIQMKFNFPIFM